MASSSRPRTTRPTDGGFKYNPPNGGPADTSTTKVIQDRANEILLAAGWPEVKRMPLARARASGRVHDYDYITPYVTRPGQRHRHGGHRRRRI